MFAWPSTCIFFFSRELFTSDVRIGDIFQSEYTTGITRMSSPPPLPLSDTNVGAHDLLNEGGTHFPSSTRCGSNRARAVKKARPKDESPYLCTRFNSNRTVRPETVNLVTGGTHN